ncbi:uncharacterized protein LOC103699165 [Phoenix dactylifera]|uniref:Uncharacterized protein LOC103699165 n=1 Tax=Phoenix dactylifera TaxID=42345 RepID=A0A8B8J0K8_PHODC|nr:uncharacterized protein LOC103699165 [Phoenix dactylifera]
MASFLMPSFDFTKFGFRSQIRIDTSWVDAYFDVIGRLDSLLPQISEELHDILIEDHCRENRKGRGRRKEEEEKEKRRKEEKKRRLDFIQFFNVLIYEKGGLYIGLTSGQSIDDIPNLDPYINSINLLSQLIDYIPKLIQSFDPII